MCQEHDHFDRDDHDHDVHDHDDRDDHDHFDRDDRGDRDVHDHDDHGAGGRCVACICNGISASAPHLPRQMEREENFPILTILTLGALHLVGVGGHILDFSQTLAPDLFGRGELYDV